MMIRIEALEVSAIIGVHEAERERPQPLLVDIEFRVPTPATDDLDATVDYSEAQAIAARCIQAGEFRLIETAAQATARRLAQTLGVDDVAVKVAKPAASRIARSVSASYRLELPGRG